MSNDKKKIAGYVCLALTVVLFFIAWERYSSNAKAVEAANQILTNSPMGEMMGGMMKQMTGKAKLEPNVPAETMYSILFAVIFGVASAILLVGSQRNQNKDRVSQDNTLAAGVPMRPNGDSDAS